MSELVDKSEVLDIWNNYWITDMTTLDVKDQLRELATVELESAPQLNENQQVVLEWLKDEKENSNLTLFDCIYSFIYGNPEDLVTQIWTELNEKEEAQVLEAFGKWMQEQEEE